MRKYPTLRPSSGSRDLMFGGRGFWEQVYWRELAVVILTCLKELHVDSGHLLTDCHVL